MNNPQSIAKRTILALLFIAHLVFGLLQAMHSQDDPAVDIVLRCYIAMSHALLVLWAWLDSRGKAVSSIWIVGVAVLGFFAMPFYLSSARPPGSWRRWLIFGILFFAGCIFAYGCAFTWLFQRTVTG